MLIRRRRLRRGVFLCLAAALLMVPGLWFCWRSLTVPATGRPPVYRGNSHDREIALTVNVFWGEEYLPEMLRVLREYRVPATFFLGGQWAAQFPALARQIAAAGHEIGNHGYAHPHPDRISPAANMQDIQAAEKIIRQITGCRLSLYAPPYGERGPGVLEAAGKAGYTTILWSLDTVDWQRPGADLIAGRVLSGAHNGAIVLMHPTAPTVQALPAIIEGLRVQGYVLVTVSQLLEGLAPEEEK